MTYFNVDASFDETVEPDNKPMEPGDKPIETSVETATTEPAKKAEDEDDDDGRDIVSIPDKTGTSVADS